MTEEDEVLLARVPEPDRDRNGIPSDEARTARSRGAQVAEAALADLILPGGVRTSVLGPGWSRDIDLHLSRMPDRERLEGFGWLPLDQLFRHLGLPGDDRWAIVDGGRILGAADLHLGPPPDPVAALLGRCRRRGEVRAREALEARALIRQGCRFPNDPVVGALARAEAWLGGDVLAPWPGDPLAPPVQLPGHRARALRRLAATAMRPRFSVAISGVDGAGKSSLARQVRSQLELAGVPASIVWTRPGMRIGPLDRLARLGKRALRHDPRPGVARVAAGERPGSLASRDGALGWTWSALVTLSFLADARGRHRRASGVVIWDRHLLDALVTMDFAYGEGSGFAVQRFLMKRLLPAAALTVYLDIAPDVAAARKPGDLFGDHAIRRQLEAYQARRREIARLRVMDAALPAEELASRLVRLVVEVGSVTRSDRARRRRLPRRA